MHALTLARQRLRARLQDSSTPRTVRLAHGLLEEGKTRFVPVLASALAQDILTRGYDARTLDRVYANHADGDLGPVGKMADRLVLDLPVHAALRERLQATTGEMAAAAILAVRAGEPEFRILSAGCGLAADLVELTQRLRRQSPDTLARLRCWGVDPDLEGVLLPEAERRSRAAGAPVRFIREDLRRHVEVRQVARREGPFHLVSCPGILQAFSLEDAAELLRFYAGLLAPGGTLLMDRWQPGESSRVADGLGARMRCHSAREVETALRGAGLSPERDHMTGEGGCILIVARKPAESESGARARSLAGRASGFALAGTTSRDRMIEALRAEASGSAVH